MLVVASGCLGLGGCKSRGWDCSPGGVQPPAWEGGLRGACGCSWLPLVAWGWGVQKPRLGLLPWWGVQPPAWEGAYGLPLVARGCLGLGGAKAEVRIAPPSPGGACAIRVVALGAGRLRDSGGCPGCYLLTLLGCGAIARFGWSLWVRGDCAIRVVALGATYLLYLGAGRLRDSGGCPGCGAIARFGWLPWVLLTYFTWVRGDCAIRVVALGAGRLRDSGGCPGCGAFARFGWLPWVLLTYFTWVRGDCRDSGGCPGCGAIARFGWSLWVRGDCAIRVVALGATYLLYLGAGRLRG